MSSKYGIPQDRPASMNAAETGSRSRARSTWIGPPAPRNSPRPALQSPAFLEQGQAGLEVPAGVAALRPAVVVGPVPAGPDHGIDASRSAEYLSQRQGDGAASDVRARLVMVGPVVSRADVLH